MSELSRVCETLGIKASVTYGTDKPIPESMGQRMTPWTVTLRMGRRRLTIPFFTESAITREPDAADVLACIVSDTSAGKQSFEEFCSEFGYDVDSRSAEKTHKACAAMAPRVRRFLGEHFDVVASAEH